MTTEGKPVPAGRAPGRSQAGPHPLGGSSGVSDGRGAVSSPCINVCEMDERSGLCRGCARTIDEIVAWGRLDDDGKRAVWALLPARRAQTGALPATSKGP